MMVASFGAVAALGSQHLSLTAAGQKVLALKKNGQMLDMTWGRLVLICSDEGKLSSLVADWMFSNSLYLTSLQVVIVVLSELVEDCWRAMH